MRLYKKEGNSLQILSSPKDDVEKGDYLLVEDTNVNRKLITQVIDVQFASVPGLLEELLRDSTTEEQIYGENFDPLGVSSHINHIQAHGFLPAPSPESQKSPSILCWRMWMATKVFPSISVKLRMLLP